MPIRSGVLSFGLVAIPVKLSPAIHDKSIHFHLLHSKCGSRIKNQLFCPHCGAVYEQVHTGGESLLNAVGASAFVVGPAPAGGRPRRASIV
jgi:hypothetical protein